MVLAFCILILCVASAIDFLVLHTNLPEPLYFLQKIVIKMITGLNKTLASGLAVIQINLIYFW